MRILHIVIISQTSNIIPMKIPIFDVQHIINQIKCASPPNNKEMHKALNNLSILLEKNTTKKKSTLEQNYIGSMDKLNEHFVDLCFLRKEIVRSFSQEYFDILTDTLKILKSNKNIVKIEENKQAPLIEWDLTPMADALTIMPTVFSKLSKAKSIIEDALLKHEGQIVDIDSQVEAFFADL